jgi:phosphonate transport system substrate-binding protein
MGYGKTDADKEVMSRIYNYSGFKESTNDQLTPIRQLELYKDRVKIENDANYNAEEKARLLADIDKKLAALAK